MCIVKDLPDRTAVDVIGQLTQTEFMTLFCLNYVTSVSIKQPKWDRKTNIRNPHQSQERQYHIDF